MRAWPALDVGWLVPANVGAGFSRLDILQAALLDYPVAAIDETEAGPWRVFFNTHADRDRAAKELPRQFPELSFQPVDVPDEDWAVRSQAELRAIRVGDIIVAPPWDVNDPAGPLRGTRPTTVVIQPSMGFGTGHHASTRLCLAALQQIDLRGLSVLDVGTGSGVLAIAASRLGASSVLAIDDDPDAIQSAGENLVLNPGVDVTLRKVDLRSATLGSHDVVTANLTGGLLIQAAGRLHDLAAASGRLILSGFMKDEEAGVRDAYSDFTIQSRSAEDEWLCVTLQRT